MSNTTITALSKMVLSFDDENLENFYHSLSKTSPEFKAQCIDKMLALFVKMEKLFEEHRILELTYRKLDKRRSEAEHHYHAWKQQHKNAKNLQELIESDPQIHQVFKKLVSLNTTNTFLDQESIDFLIQAEKTLDEKITELHQEQISLDKQYIRTSWDTHRRLAKILREISKRLPLKEIYQTNPTIFDTASEQVVFTLSELFFISVKKTPTGYQYILLEDFIQQGMHAINEYFSTQAYPLIKFFAQELLIELYQELADFYGTFQGTQEKIDTTVSQREAMGKTLSDKVSKLKELVGEYTNQLSQITRTTQEIESYATTMKVLRTPKPPPTLTPGGG